MYKALKTFTGLVRMRKGEVKDIEDKAIVKDLLNAGYIEDISAPESEKTTKSRAKKGGGEVENAE